MADKIQIEIWVVMNEDGEYTAASEQSTAVEEFEENFSGAARRLVKLNVWIAPPDVIEAEVTVADDAGTVAMESETGETND